MSLSIIFFIKTYILQLILQSQILKLFSNLIPFEKSHIDLLIFALMNIAFSDSSASKLSSTASC